MSIRDVKVPIVINDYNAFQTLSITPDELIRDRPDITFFKTLLSSLSNSAEDVYSGTVPLDKDSSYEDTFDHVFKNNITNCYFQRPAGNKLYASSSMQFKSAVVNRFVRCLNGNTLFPSIAPTRLAKSSLDESYLDSPKTPKQDKPVYRMYNIPKESNNRLVIPSKYLVPSVVDINKEENDDLNVEECHTIMNDFISNLCSSLFNAWVVANPTGSITDETIDAVATALYTCHLSLACNEFPNTATFYKKEDPVTYKEDGTLKTSVPYYKLAFNPETYTVNHISISFLPLTSSSDILYDNHLKIVFHLQRNQGLRNPRVNVADFNPRKTLVKSLRNKYIKNSLASRLGKTVGKASNAKTPRSVVPTKVQIINNGVSLTTAMTKDMEDLAAGIVSDIMESA